MKKESKIVCAKWKTYEISSIHEYIKFIVELNLKKKFDISASRKYRFLVPKTDTFGNYCKIYDELNSSVEKEYYYYRGVSDYSYHLLPSIFRHVENNAEYTLYHEMLSKCYDNFKGLNSVERLVNMQHYNCHTRLLDITINPLVALYFACKSYSNNDNKDKAGAVYIFAFSKDETHYFDSARIQMLSHLARLNDDEKKEILKVSLKKVGERKNQFKIDANTGNYKNKCIEKFYLDICNDIVAFKREILPFDLLAPLLFIPSKSNDRIRKQDGAFIISGLSEDNNVAEAKLRMLTKYKLIINNKNTILDELNYLSINESTLFPEIDNVAKYLVDSIK